MKQRPITNWDDVPVIMDPVYAARLLGLTPTRVREMCRNSEIPCTRFGKLWRICKGDLQSFMEGKAVEKVS